MPPGRSERAELLAAGMLKDVMEQPAAAEAVEQGWAPGSAVMAVRITC